MYRDVKKIIRKKITGTNHRRFYGKIE